MSEDDFEPSQPPEMPDRPDSDAEPPRSSTGRRRASSEQEQADQQRTESARRGRKSAAPSPGEEAREREKIKNERRKTAPTSEEKPSRKAKPKDRPKRKRVLLDGTAPKSAPPRGKWRDGTLQERIARVRWTVWILSRYAPFFLLAAILIVVFGPALFLRLNINRPPVSRIFTPEIQHWSAQITKWAAQYDVNPNLIATLMQIESCGDPFVGSGAGAQGLFQVMPFNFADNEDMTDPETNALRGIGVIQNCLKLSKGDISLAMACYNGGQGLLFRSPDTWPDETKRYVTWGAGIYNDAVNGAQSSPTLSDWLAAGGAGLCRESSVALGLPTPQAAIVAPPATSQPTTAPTSQPTVASTNPPGPATASASARASYSPPTPTFPPLPSSAAPGLKLFLTPTAP
ncbi:MAG TPA: transglycosylase SLT domain-containing protein [Aggregatilineales bacterium]|nr:transglycosylase SLT domain-containing protein [Aggregatilineales bacterium]